MLNKVGGAAVNTIATAYDTESSKRVEQVVVEGDSEKWRGRTSGELK